MFRLLLILMIVFAATVWIEPRWNAGGRELVLRLRESTEIMVVVRKQARALGRRVVQATGDAVGPAPVSAPGPATKPRDDELTAADREALDRLIERRLRESEHDATQGAN